MLRKFGQCLLFAERGQKRESSIGGSGRSSGEIVVVVAVRVELAVV